MKPTLLAGSVLMLGLLALACWARPISAADLNLIQSDFAGRTRGGAGQPFCSGETLFMRGTTAYFWVQCDRLTPSLETVNSEAGLTRIDRATGRVYESVASRPLAFYPPLLRPRVVLLEVVSNAVYGATNRHRAALTLPRSQSSRYRTCER